MAVSHNQDVLMCLRLDCSGFGRRVGGRKCRNGCQGCDCDGGGDGDSHGTAPFSHEFPYLGYRSPSMGSGITSTSGQFVLKETSSDSLFLRSCAVTAGQAATVRLTAVPSRRGPPGEVDC